MKIGLLGFGVVGRGVYEITENRDDMQVTKVLCLEDIKLPDAEAVKDIRAIVEDDSIDTVVRPWAVCTRLTNSLGLPWRLARTWSPRIRRWFAPSMTSCCLW